MSETNKSLLITGANAGLGKECARQMSLLPEVGRIVLGCRSKAKAEAAKAELEAATAQEGNTGTTFEILIVDVSDLESIKNAVESLSSPVDALVMNAGGMGGQNPHKVENHGVMNIVNVNLLGHVALFDGLRKAKKLNKTAIYAGSEAARGIPMLGFPAVKIKSGSIEEFISMCDGSFYAKENPDPNFLYGGTKYMAALWVASAARSNPDMRIITVSPGMTSGTSAVDNAPTAFQRLFFKWIAFPVMTLLGKSHSLEKGAKRYVDVLTDPESYKSGIFYASDGLNNVTGKIVDQSNLCADFAGESFQNNADEALHSFLGAGAEQVPQ